MSPLYRLVQDTKWTWSDQHRLAFNKAKDLLQSSALLVHFDSEKELVVSCDASPYGLGAVLAHRMDDECEQPMRSLSPAEKKYSQLEEGLAIVFAIKKFKQYLYGRSFTIYSDHQPLKYLCSRPVPTMAASRIQCWALTLSAYNYTIQHRPCRKMANADAVSRLPLPDMPSAVPALGDIHCLFELLSESIFDTDQVVDGERPNAISCSSFHSTWLASDQFRT